MREFMPTTHADAATVARYAAGEVGLDAISEDRGPRRRSTMDRLLDDVGFRARERDAERDARFDG